MRITLFQPGKNKNPPKTKTKPKEGLTTGRRSPPLHPPPNLQEAGGLGARGGSTQTPGHPPPRPAMAGQAGRRGSDYNSRQGSAAAAAGAGPGRSRHFSGRPGPSLLRRSRSRVSPPGRAASLVVFPPPSLPFPATPLGFPPLPSPSPSSPFPFPRSPSPPLTSARRP